MYHLSIKPISRSTGRSATSAAAYRSADIVFCKRYGVTHDYSHKSGVEHTQLVGWENDRASLWNAAEAAENRGNSRVARECLIGLPFEANATERKELSVSMAKYFFQKYKVAVDVAVHEPSRRGDQRNYHAHLLFTTRAVGEACELGKKTRVLDDLNTGPQEIEQARLHWALLLNQFYDQAGEDKKVDHRSYRRQGLDLEPTVHLGPAATALERRGIHTQYTEDESTGREQRLKQAKRAIEEGELRIARITEERARRKRQIVFAEQAAAWGFAIIEQAREEAEQAARTSAGRLRQAQSIYERFRIQIRSIHQRREALVFSELHRSYTAKHNREKLDHQWPGGRDLDDGNSVDQNDRGSATSGITTGAGGEASKVKAENAPQPAADTRGFFQKHWDRWSGKDEHRRKTEELEAYFLKLREQNEKTWADAQKSYEAPPVTDSPLVSEIAGYNQLLKTWQQRLANESSVDSAELPSELSLNRQLGVITLSQSVMDRLLALRREPTELEAREHSSIEALLLKNERLLNEKRLQSQQPLELKGVDYPFDPEEIQKALREGYQVFSTSIGHGLETTLQQKLSPSAQLAVVYDPESEMVKLSAKAIRFFKEGAEEKIPAPEGCPNFAQQCQQVLELNVALKRKQGVQISKRKATHQALTEDLSDRLRRLNPGHNQGKNRGRGRGL